MRIEVLIRYHVDDEKFMGDYCEVSIIVDGVTVRTYGDAYHDRGLTRAESFIDGIVYAIGNSTKIQIAYQKVADYE